MAGKEAAKDGGDGCRISTATMGAATNEDVQREPEFPAFPFKPYPIQIQFMRALYDVLPKGGVAMLESPTGTGKTLSIICSALQWLVDHRSDQANGNSRIPENEGGSAVSGDADEPDWMRDFVPATDNNGCCRNDAAQHNSVQERIRKPRDVRQLGGVRSGVRNGVPDKQMKQNVGFAEGSGVEELDEFLVDDYDSGEEGTVKRKAAHEAAESEDDDENDDRDDKEETEVVPKVYFCSRTHSQLTQFVKELRKTIFATEIKVVCLGSRQNMCTNADVLKLGSLTRINERCLELQKNKKKGNPRCRSKVKDDGKLVKIKCSSGCPMLSKRKLQKQYRVEIYRFGALDIEDAVQLGRNVGTCPYYGSRSMIQAADLVILPYQSLLMKSSRESLGLKLRNNIIIIDEAHNLADALTNMYNSKVTTAQLQHVRSSLSLYLERFQERLGAGNRRYIQTFMILVESFLQVMVGEKDIKFDGCSLVKNNSESVKEESLDYSMAINDFLFSLDIDNINLVKLQEYIKESNIIYKVSGFAVKLATPRESSDVADGVDKFSVAESIQSSFQAFAGFLMSLTSSDYEGRIIISKQNPSSFDQQYGGFLKFVMLAGEKIFSEIIDEARAVVLAGGTLQPIEEMKERLFPCLSEHKLHFFSCNHIVPPESVLPIAVSCGPTGGTFDFSYQSRSSIDMKQELGRLICNIAAVVPEGIIVFFPSFEYAREVYDAWKSLGILERIQKKKRVFREPRGSADVENLLKEYGETINACTNKGPMQGTLHDGAMLLAVVGGKVSEGINFSDGMGRCVVMVGLPYPNLADVELIERIKHIEGLAGSECAATGGRRSIQGCTALHGLAIINNCKLRGREYYENLCMKAVNQSIGRAIRHIDDYAAMLLVDVRYTSKRGSWEPPVKKLPEWIRTRLVTVTQNFGEVYRQLHLFFKFNRERTAARNL